MRPRLDPPGQPAIHKRARQRGRRLTLCAVGARTDRTRIEEPAGADPGDSRLVVAGQLRASLVPADTNDVATGTRASLRVTWPAHL
jgi:hypothetical protein